MRRGLPAVALGALAACCNPARPLQAMPRGGIAVDVGVPAVLVRTASATFPVGDLVVGARYAVTDGLEVGARLHPAALVTATVAVQAGLTWHVTRPEGGVPAVHLGGTGLFLTNPRGWSDGPEESLRGALELEVLLHWEPLPWLWPYLVFEDAVELRDGGVIATVAAGIQCWVTDRVGLSAELGLTGIGQRSSALTASYVGASDHGALWIGLGFIHRVGPASPVAPGRRGGS